MKKNPDKELIITQMRSRIELLAARIEIITCHQDLILKMIDMVDKKS